MFLYITVKGPHSKFYIVSDYIMFENTNSFFNIYN